MEMEMEHMEEKIPKSMVVNVADDGGSVICLSYYTGNHDCQMDLLIGPIFTGFFAWYAPN